MDGIHPTTAWHRTVAFHTIIRAIATGCPTLIALLLMTACESSGRTTGGVVLNSWPKERWTILCKEFSGMDHRNHCESYHESLIRTPGIRENDVSCDHDDRQDISRLYYGSYTRRVNLKTGERTTPEQLVRDLQLIQDLGDPRSGRHFSQARMTWMPQKKTGPAEWDLRNAPGLYSLQIAVFYPAPGYDTYRNDAVQLVEDLRKDGHPAYYYHGEVQSMVTVGSFDENDVLVSRDGTYQDGAAVKAYRRRDPRFRYNYENFQVRSKVIGNQRYPSESFLVRIPDNERSASP